LHCIIFHLPAFVLRKYKISIFGPFTFTFRLFIIYYQPLKVLLKNFFPCWRYVWVNRDVAAKWAAKKDMPAGKYGIKLPDNDFVVAQQALTDLRHSPYIK